MNNGQALFQQEPLLYKISLRILGADNGGRSEESPEEPGAENRIWRILATIY